MDCAENDKKKKMHEHYCTLHKQKTFYLASLKEMN